MCVPKASSFGECFSCQTLSPSLVWKEIGSWEMLQQHGKHLDDSHKLMLFGFDRKINSSHMIKHLWILRENQYFHKTKLLCVHMITAFKVLCIMRTATISVFYFGFVSHIRTFSNFKSSSSNMVTQIHTLFYLVFQSLLMSLFNLPLLNDNIKISVCILS